MTCRELKPDDLQSLDATAKSLGFPYPPLGSKRIELVRVVEDEHGQIVAACAVERICQCYFWPSETHQPITVMNALKLLHAHMIPALKSLGYNECEGFISPDLATRFGKRLERSFGWLKNPWPSWTKHF